MIKIGNNHILDMGRTTLNHGTITTNNNSIILTSTTDNDKAYLHRFVATRAGSRVVVRVTARCLSQPTAGKEMKLGIDDYLRSLVNQVKIDSTDWRTYTISTIVPEGKNQIVFFKAVVGAWSNQISSIEVAEFNIYIEDAGFSSQRTHAMGLIELSSNAVHINEQYAYAGIRGLTYQNGELNIQTDNFTDFSLWGTLPIQYLQLQASVKCPVQAYVADFNHSTGIIKVKFADTKTGENVDIRTAPYNNGGNVFKLHLNSVF